MRKDSSVRPRSTLLVSGAGEEITTLCRDVTAGAGLAFQEVDLSSLWAAVGRQTVAAIVLHVSVYQLDIVGFLALARQADALLVSAWDGMTSAELENMIAAAACRRAA